jgi:spore coat protein CotH
MLALLVACDSSTVLIGAVGGEDPRDTGTFVGDTSVEGAPGDTSPQDTAEEVDDPEADAAWQEALFSDSVVHEIAITLSRDAERALWTDPYEFTAADATFDGEAAPTLGLRLRGKIGSFRDLAGKPKFKIDFKQYGAGTFHGLHALALNNEVVDCSFLKEPVAARAFRDAGVPAPRTGFATVTVNGDAYGLYVIMEVPDDVFLERWYPGDDAGNLYDGKYLYDAATRSYTLLDFDSGLDDLYQLEEGVEDGNLQIHAVSDAMSAAGDAFAADMDPLVNWDEQHLEWAVEQWSGHVDGYAMNDNNYRVYFPPSTGKMQMLPWDFDYAFLEESSWGYSWSRPTGLLARRCFRDAACYDAQKAAVLAAIGADDGEGLIDIPGYLGWYDGMVELIAGAVADDPRRECNRGQVESYQDYVRSWISSRGDAMRSSWGL